MIIVYVCSIFRAPIRYDDSICSVCSIFRACIQYAYSPSLFIVRLYTRSLDTEYDSMFDWCLSVAEVCLQRIIVCLMVY